METTLSVSTATTAGSRWLSQERAAREAGVSVRTLERWRRRGLLRAYRPVPGGRVFIDATELDAAIRQHAETPSAA